MFCQMNTVDAFTNFSEIKMCGVIKSILELKAQFLVTLKSHY